MKASDILKDHNHGGLSSTKLWFHVANVVASVVVVFKAYKNELSDDMFLWYLAIVGGATLVSKGIGKIGGKGLPPGAA